MIPRKTGLVLPPSIKHGRNYFSEIPDYTNNIVSKMGLGSTESLGISGGCAMSIRDYTHNKSEKELANQWAVISAPLENVHSYADMFRYLRQMNNTGMRVKFLGVTNNNPTRPQIVFAIPLPGLTQYQLYCVFLTLRFYYDSRYYKIWKIVQEMMEIHPELSFFSAVQLAHYYEGATDKNTTFCYHQGQATCQIRNFKEAFEALKTSTFNAVFTAIPLRGTTILLHGKFPQNFKNKDLLKTLFKDERIA